MPAFQTPMAGDLKRKSDSYDYGSRKRPAVDRDVAQADQWQGQSRHGGTQCWMVQWRNPQFKKHKTWDGDAILTLTGSKGTLYDIDGKALGQGSLSESPKEGREFKFGGKELEIDRVIPPEDFFSGACFGRATSLASSAPVIVNSAGPSKQFKPLKLNPLSASRSSYSNTERRGIPLQPVDLISAVDAPPKNNPAKLKIVDSHWTANWRKPQQKKHKTWDGDAFVSHVGEKLTMISEEGKVIGSTAWKGDPLYSGYHCFIGSREVELDTKITASQLPDIIGKDIENNPSPPSTPEKPSFLLHSNAAAAKLRPHSPSLANSTSSAKKFVPPTSFYGQPALKPKPKGPLHNPDDEGAVVMKVPTKEHAKKFNKKDLPIVPVVLDPIVARHLRPHQKEGVKFLYECVMGLRKHEGQGCILGDEMGLGKTLQTITLVWTLLKQNPYAGAGPVVGKALIVCPVTLVNNWKAEFHKWLGRDRVGVFVGDKDKSVIKQFINSRIHQVLIIGYERLRTVIDDLAYCNPPIGLIICDEGHRLKSANNKTSAMFKALRTPRRVILSGTPIQNDLSEFHAMSDFCNPGLLDDYSTFRRVYETPILKSRAPDCTPKENEIGEARSAQLLAIARSFVLRREATILKNYLPPKHEYVVFITPTALQLSIFSTILNPDRVDNIVQSSTAESLALIGMLTKISNSPILLKATADSAKSKGGEGIKRAGFEEALKLLPERAQIEDFSLSGKLTALSCLLKNIREHTEEKCILVSHYTSTLNILEAYCKKKNYTYFRLDGQTPAAKRQEYVNIFNKSSQHSRFLFLLSSKAGGVGLNLIGASRLCLIDSDWNPSHDLQSMARIHRDGQKRPVFIYRFLTAGTIDEKIYQRQVTKIGLSNSLMGSGTSGSKSDSFTRKDLRDIFRVHPNASCNTHDLLECPCGHPQDSLSGSVDHETKEPQDSDSDPIEDDDSDTEKGFVAASQVRPEEINKMDKAYLKKKKAELASLGEWTHINCLRPTARDDIHDDILRKLIYVPKTEEKKVLPPPKSRIDALLSAIDLENVAAMDEEVQTLGVRDVPGGTVSFLFEKGSTSALPEDDDSQDVNVEDLSS